VKVAIANFSKPIDATLDFESYWASHQKPEGAPRASLFEQDAGWGFHIYSLGVHMLDKGTADEVEFWDFSEPRRMHYQPNGVLAATFHNEADLDAYLARYGDPDLFVNHGRYGHGALRLLEGRCFRVHVPALRSGLDQTENFGAECYLVDAEEYLDDRSMLYVPVVNTRRFRPLPAEKRRDFVYLATCYYGKRHDIVIDAVKGTELTGHFHPVDSVSLDLTGTRITTSNWGEIDLVELLATSRFAVYAGDDTSNPAAMWECVAAGLPIVVNREIRGGKHLVVPGVTGELASEPEFREVMQRVLANHDSYSPRRYFEEHWDTVETIESYLAFFQRMGWEHPCS
jgi:hypothetical protein